jgi:hypothetical protein
MEIETFEVENETDPSVILEKLLTTDPKLMEKTLQTLKIMRLLFTSISKSKALLALVIKTIIQKVLR